MHFRVYDHIYLHIVFTYEPKNSIVMLESEIFRHVNGAYAYMQYYKRSMHNDV